MEEILDLRSKKEALRENLEAVDSALEGAEGAEGAEALHELRREIVEGMEQIDAAIQQIITAMATRAEAVGTATGDSQGRRSRLEQEATSATGVYAGSEDAGRRRAGPGAEDGRSSPASSGASEAAGRDSFHPEELAVGAFCSTLYEGRLRNAVVVARPVLSPVLMLDVIIVGLGIRTQVGQVQPPLAPPSGFIRENRVLRVAYSHDWVFYNARILRILPNNEVLVHYVDYGNEEAASLYAVDPSDTTDLASVSGSSHRASSSSSASASALASASASASASPSAGKEQRPLMRRDRKREDEQTKKVAAWQTFATKTTGTKRTGFLTGKIHKESIFRSPDSVDGKVGVTGSGKGMTQFHLRERHDFKLGSQDGEDDPLAHK